MTEYVAQINTENYNSQCKYVKKKLLSVNSCDISRIIFLYYLYFCIIQSYYKLYVIRYNLPCYLMGLDIEINEKK